VKHIVSVSLFSLVSAFATANSPAPAAAPAATPAPASAPAAASSSASTKVSMRVQLDPFYKNLNQANKNYKTPKLDSFRLKFERDLGQYSSAMVELRLHELENVKKYVINETSKRTTINTDVLKYYQLLFKVPGVDGLELGYVREIESALYGMTDKTKGSNVAQAVAFTGHMNRIEGYRAVYDTGWSDLKVTYHLARLGLLDDASFSDLNDKKSDKEYADTTWYHKVTTDFKIDKTPVQIGVGTQGKWLGVKDESKPSYDLFIHLLAEHKMEDMKFKAGVAHDSYATVKADGSAGKNVATTYLVAGKYDLLPKEFSVLSELNFRTLKAAESSLTDFSSSDKKSVDSATEAAYTLAGQYMVDEKLSFIPSYTYYNSNRSQAWVDNANGDAFGARSTLLGSDNKSAKFEQAIGLRIRYDY
jgi:hypothetical protein